MNPFRIASLVLLALASCASPQSRKETDPLKRLLDGNRRFVEEKREHPNQTIAHLVEVARGQRPFAIVLACSDSRVPPEILFDQGLGDLFIVRVAGNIVNDDILGSLEYAVEHLHASLIVVLGHARCGAVDATLQGIEAPGHVASLIRAIQPAVDEVKGKPGDPLDNAVRANVTLTVARIKSAQPVLSHDVEKGELRVVGAWFDLDTGAVEIIP